MVEMRTTTSHLPKNEGFSDLGNEENELGIMVDEESELGIYLVIENEN
jgi:hypothetical protein